MRKALRACVAGGVLLYGAPALADNGDPAPPPIPVAPPPTRVAVPVVPGPALRRWVAPRAAPAARPRVVKRPAWVKGKPVADVPLVAGLPIASFPGFTHLDDGKSRIFIEVDAKVDISEKRDPGRLVYRLRNTAVTQHTNALPLITSYFSTPVDRVQLVQDGADVQVVIELRENTASTFQIVETPRGIVLWVDFPRSAAAASLTATTNPDGDGSEWAAKRLTTSRRLGSVSTPSDDSTAPPSAAAAPAAAPVPAK